MSQIDRRMMVLCPLAQAAMRLEQFFKAHGNTSGDTAKLTLHLAATIGPIPMTFQRSVVATFQLQHRRGDMEPHYRLQWAPEKPGPLPLFSGDLTVLGDDDYTSFTLVLRGAYEPPMGALGSAFDSVIGNDIAQETANDLLRQIRSFVQNQFTNDEDRKRRNGSRLETRM